MTIEHDGDGTRLTGKGVNDAHGLATQGGVLAHRRLRMTIDISVTLRDLTAADVSNELRQLRERNDGADPAVAPLIWKQARARRAFLHALVNNEQWLDQFLLTCLSGLTSDGGGLTETLRNTFHLERDAEDALFITIAESLTPEENAFFMEAQQRDQLVNFLELVLDNVHSDVEVVDVKAIDE